VYKRPFATHYYRFPTDTGPELVSQGAAKTEEGAIRATVVRVFVGQYAKAIIYDRDSGSAMYHVITGPGGLRVRYGSGVQYKVFKEA